MVEWFKAAFLKSADGRKIVQGFESLSLRHFNGHVVRIETGEEGTCQRS